MLYIIKVNGLKYLFFMKEVSTMADLELGNKEINAELAETAAPDADVKGKKGKKKEKKQKNEKELSPKKKAKLEKKAEKAEIKALRKEAKVHSLKIEKRRARWTRFLAIVLIIAVLGTTGILGYTFYGILTGSIGSGSSSETAAQNPSPNTNNATPANTTPTPAPSNNSAEPASNAAGGASTAAPADAGDLSTPAGVVAYYKSAHAKTLADAKSVSRVYSNTLNYNSVLEIGDSSALAKIAQSLMSSFMKEDTSKVDYTGADMAKEFPGKNAQNLTADMVSEASCKDNGDTYTIVIKINSTDQSPDDGTKSSCIVPVVNEKSITDAAGSMVKLDGIANEYVGSNITATIDKASGRITHIETDCPSYMKFAKAGVAIITVENCRIGLEYLTKWDVNY